MRSIHHHRVEIELDFPSIHAEVFKTEKGVPYLRDHGLVLVGQTAAHLSGIVPFLTGLDPSFGAYVLDTPLDSGALLSKFAGQLCYLSMGEVRTRNEDAAQYFDNIKAQGHGSVLEHPVYTFLFYGIDRAVTHELVRHRVGTAFSQVSQRYVGPETVRYVMPKELQGDATAENQFAKDIETNVAAYSDRRKLLEDLAPDLHGESRRDKRKRMQSFARRALANETEAPIVVSGNVRAWRHILAMRCQPAADAAIRRPMHDVLRLLKAINPIGFDDFEDVQLADGSMSAKPKHPKV